jgi:PD-(D/E)XK endonuclease
VLTTDRKGNIAEAEIAAAAIRLGIDVYRPFGEGGRYDIVLDVGSLIGVQCKWAPLRGDVIIVRCYSTRRNRDGLLKRIYEPGEIDAFCAYCPETDECYFLPYGAFSRRTQVQLRLRHAKNNQRLGVNWAKDFEFAATLGRSPGAIAQLGERLDGIQKVAGSSPAGSTRIPPR